MSQFKVQDMTCGHCEKTITTALQKAGADFSVDLKAKTVEVRNLADEAVTELLKDLGYTPELMK